MSNTEIDRWAAWRGHTVIDAEGSKIGKLDDIYVDEDTNAPEWLSITTGMFGSKQSFAPLTGASADGDDLRIPFTKDKVKGSPNVDPDGYLTPAQEDELYRYYEVGDRVSGQAPPAMVEGTARAEEAMTRSEEQLRVGVERREAGRFRLRKWVETEHVTQTVPVKREHVTVEREPITDANRDQAMAGAEISEDEQEMILTEERPVVATETVPVERVRLNKETFVEEQEVGGDIRKERIETEGPEATPKP